MWTVSPPFEAQQFLIQILEILFDNITTHSSPGYFAFLYWLAATTTVGGS